MQTLGGAPQLSPQELPALNQAPSPEQSVPLAELQQPSQEASALSVLAQGQQSGAVQESVSVRPVESSVAVSSLPTLEEEDEEDISAGISLEKSNHLDLVADTQNLGTALHALENQILGQKA